MSEQSKPTIEEMREWVEKEREFSEHQIQYASRGAEPVWAKRTAILTAIREELARKPSVTMDRLNEILLDACHVKTVEPFTMEIDPREVVDELRSLGVEVREEKNTRNEKEG